MLKGMFPISARFAGSTGILLWAFGVQALSAQDKPFDVDMLSSSSQTVQFANDGPMGTLGLFYSHGYFIQFKHYVGTSSEPSIYLHDSSGSLTRSIVLWPPGTKSLHLSSVDVGEHKGLVFAGESVNAYGDRAHFIATSDLDGTDPHYFSTGTFFASRIIQAEDSSIWALGTDNGEDDAGVGSPRTNYDTLRHFGSNGVLLDHLLPRWGENTAYVVYSAPAPDGSSQFTAFDIDHHAISHVGLQGQYSGLRGPTMNWLRASGDGIVLYEAGVGKIYRYSAATRTLDSQSVDIQDQVDNLITGFAVTSDGEIFISTNPRDEGHPTTLGGLYKLSDDRSDRLAKWRRVSQDSSIHPRIGNRFWLLGSDNNSLVFRNKSTQVHWSTVSGQDSGVSQ